MPGAVLVKAFLLMAARLMSPGPIRLKLVRRAHNLRPVPAAPEAPERAA